MFREYLKDWQSVVSGIGFADPSAAPEQPAPLPLTIQDHHLEIFFCLSGFLRISRPFQSPVVIRKQEILLLSSCNGLRSAETDGSGFCLSIDLTALQEILSQFRESFRLDLRQEQIESVLSAESGCLCIPNTAWTRSMLSILQMLPQAQQGNYCILKSLELLYLLCTRQELLDSVSDLSASWGYLSHTVAQMKSYMEAHLDEKLTIFAMSKQFHISPTAFKSCFRSLYGQPVHSWLLEYRMEHSAKLLTATPMTVLQIAQDVGYESVGQFNVAFKRQFGMTPTQYRKMSISKNV